MSKADKIFIDLCKDILENGSTTEGQDVRPKWEDGSSAYTIKKFGVCNKYDLREEFPALTLRKTALKSAMDEILWIYQKKSNNIKDLNSHIWDEWADESGSIGKAYGYQVGQEYIHHNYYRYISNPVAGSMIAEPRFLDQMDGVLYDLKYNPFSRRIMINLWNIFDLSEMNLQPCCYNVIFNVTDEGQDKLVLNMTLNQRSADILTANNWNVCQYALLLMMVAQVSDMIPGVMMHCITDAHIYDRHVDLVKELISRETYDAPIVTLNPDIKDFYKFTTKDLTVENYKHGEQIKIPVAI
jgi:thymidylate synthase